MLYNDSINNLLKFPENFSVSFKETKNGEQKLLITLARTTHKCPCCGTSTAQVHDYREQTVQDIPLQMEKFSVVFRKRRYVCPHCGKRFYEENPFLSPYKRQTNRFRQRVLVTLSELRSIQSIADDFFCSAGIIRRVMECIHYAKPVHLPRVLAINEFRGNVGSKFQCLLVDPQHRDVLDVLPTRNSEDLYAYFSAYSKQERRKVRYIVMDLSSQFCSIMRACFPKAKIIADKFHVVRLINWAVDSVRKEEQKKFYKTRRRYFKRSKTLLLKKRSDLTDEEKEQLANMLMVSPRLQQAYGLKELFYDMMASRTRKEIQERYRLFLKHAMQANLEAFNKHIQTINKWFQAIVRGILTGYTNGFVEGCNNRTKVFKRVSYGLRNFEVFRNRLFHLANNTAQKRKVRKLSS